MNRTQWSIAVCLLVGAMAGCVRVAATPEVKPPEAVVAVEQPAPKPDPLAPWPMFGGTPSRNMVNLVDKNIPVTWNVEAGKQKNIKWVADIGDKAYGGPVIADGKVFVGTNNKNPRDKKVGSGHKAVLMAFNEADGKFLWQIVHDYPKSEALSEAQSEGLCSTPCVEGKRLYYTTPGCVVVCADTSGKVQWTYDMMKELDVVPHHLGNCSPLIVGDLVMLITGNGVDNEGKVVSPMAPSFIAINKNTGTLAWKSSLPGNNIIEGQWSNPTLAIVDGKQQVIFPGGDAFIYALEPKTGDVIWRCNCNPNRVKQDRKVDNYMIGTPVVVGDRLFIGMGTYPDDPSAAKQYGHVLCIDIAKKGDVSPKNLNAKDPANKGSALVWAFGGPIIPPPPGRARQNYFGPTISTACVHNGLLFMCENGGYIHCLDAKTGERYWYHDTKGAFWGSAYYVDGKVYANADDGDVYIFKHGKKRQFYADGKLHDAFGPKDKVEGAASMENAGLHSTPVVANGVLYIATRTKVYAIANGK